MADHLPRHRLQHAPARPPSDPAGRSDPRRGRLRSRHLSTLMLACIPGTDARYRDRAAQYPRSYSGRQSMPRAAARRPAPAAAAPASDGDAARTPPRSSTSGRSTTPAYATNTSTTGCASRSVAPSPTSMMGPAPRAATGSSRSRLPPAPRQRRRIIEAAHTFPRHRMHVHCRHMLRRHAECLRERQHRRAQSAADDADLDALLPQRRHTSRASGTRCSR
jgi:hypothetical protein